MKRRLSLLLAVVMILGSFSFAFAAEETAEEKAGAFLMKVGVLEGINGELKLEDNLRRQDAVVLVARLHGAEDEAKKFPTDDLKFTDFKDPFYRPIIAWAVANDLVEGHTPERFGFNEDVTAQQYATILLRALGYNDDVAGKDGYAKALELAKKLGVLENVEVENDTAITRGQMAVMTFNALGVKMKDSDKTLAEFLGIEMPVEKETELKVEEVKADNLKEIKVVLNDASLANKNRLEDAANYRSNAGEIIDAKLMGNEVVLLLADGAVMKQNSKYNLAIQDVDKAINTIGKERYEFKAFDNEAPEIEKVEVLGTKGIRVTMSEPVQESDERDFELNKGNIVMEVITHGRDVTLVPYRENDKFPLGENELKIAQLKDFAGFKSREDKRAIEVVEYKDAPEVVDVVAKNNSVIVEFDKEVLPTSLDKTNVSWTQVRGKVSTKADGYRILSGNRVEYIFKGDNELPKPAVEITVKDVENYSGYAMETYTKVHNIELDFSRPEVVEYRLLDQVNGKERLEVVFSKEIDRNSVKDPETYVLYKDVAKKDNIVTGMIFDTELLDDNKTVIITFEEELANKGNHYVLEIGGIHDTTTLKNTMITEYLEFTIGISDDLKVVDYEVEYYNEDKETKSIVLEFNRQLARAEAENPRNYEFISDRGTEWAIEDLSKDYSIRLFGNGYKVEIKLPRNGKTINEVKLGLGIRDLDGNRLNEDYRYVWIRGSILNLDKAVRISDTEVRLTFNQKVKFDTTIDASKVALLDDRYDPITGGEATNLTLEKNAKGEGIAVIATFDETALDAAKRVKIDSGSGILSAVNSKEALPRVKPLVTDIETVLVDLDARIVEDNTVEVTLKFSNPMDVKSVENVVLTIGGVKYSFSTAGATSTLIFEDTFEVENAAGKKVVVKVNNKVKDANGKALKADEKEVTLAPLTTGVIGTGRITKLGVADVKEVGKLTVTTTATNAGNITISNVATADVTVAVDTADTAATIAGKIANAINAADGALYEAEVDETDNTVVNLTAKEVGVKTAPVADDVGSTGVTVNYTQEIEGTASVAEEYELTVTGATNKGTLLVKLNDKAVEVEVAAGNTAGEVATRIATAFANDADYTVTANGAVVIFVDRVPGAHVGNTVVTVSDK